MPELPEVETVCRGIAPFVEGQKITRVIVRESRLRWPVVDNLENKLKNLKILQVARRGKYIILNSQKSALLIHLGMSGHVRILSKQESPKKHDHIDICFDNKKLLRYHDPRRFGAVLWQEDNRQQHFRLAHYGPEPLSRDFSVSWLHAKARKRQCAIKTLIMDNKIVVGVGNIYASEALFRAGIKPDSPASTLNEIQITRLIQSIQYTLKLAIKRGGTTLKDFLDMNGNPGYFSQSLNVYGRVNQPCYTCHSKIKHYKMQGRATYYCPSCQKR